MMICLLIGAIGSSITLGQVVVGKETYAAFKGANVVLNKVHDGGKSGIQSRHIYVISEEAFFTKENLALVFEEYEKLFPTPQILTITIFSDRNELQKLINFDAHPMTIEFAETPEGKEAQAKFYERNYPAPQGYLRAKYSRYDSYEFFDYTPLKNSPNPITVTLKSQVKRLLAKDPRGAIFEAVQTGDIEAVRAILNKGIDINFKNDDGNTPMMHAAAAGQDEIIRILAEKQADIGARNKAGYSTIDIACRMEMYGSVKVLVELGANPNSRSVGLATPLITASLTGNKDIIKLLLDAGADVNARTKFDVHALMVAPNADIASLLLSAGAQIDGIDQDNRSALFYAVEDVQPDKIGVLLKHGAKTGLKDKNGNTVIDIVNRIENQEKRQQILKLFKKYP
jgi:ankyrin repeat protein/Zn-finger nucleic acid-binding protein